MNPGTTSLWVSRLLVLGASVVFTVLNVAAPLGQGVTTDLVVYHELFGRNWQELGFGASLGVPSLGVLGDSVAARHPYLHHPPIGLWPPHVGRALLGRTPGAHRLIPTLLTALGALLLFEVLRGQTGASWGVLGALAFLLLPIIQLYGTMPSTEPFMPALGLAQVALWWRWHANPSRGRFVVMVAWFFALGLLDWHFYFLAPGIWVAELLGPRKTRRLRTSLVLLPAGVLAVVAVLGHFSCALGSPKVVIEDMVETFRSTAIAASAEERAHSELGVGFAEAQVRFVVDNLGTPGSVLFLIALIVLLARAESRRDPLVRTGVVFLVAAILSVVIFRTPSSTHGFYWYPFAVSYPMFLVAALHRHLRIAPANVRAVLAFLVVGAAAATGLWECREEKARLENHVNETLALEIDARVPKDHWVMIPNPTAVEAMVYSSRRWLPPLGFPDPLREILAARDAGKLPFRRLAVFLFPADAAQWPELAAFLEAESVRRSRPPESPFGGIRIYSL